MAIVAETVQVKERPILFSGPMVRALLAGHKTQTRRLIKPQPNVVNGDGSDALWRDAKLDLWRNARQYARDCCPYGSVGERLWVRESHALPGLGDTRNKETLARFEPVLYRADVGKQVFDIGGNWTLRDADFKWRPSIHMPRYHCRVELRITEMRIERLHDIPPTDVLKEGFIEWTDPPRVPSKHYGLSNADVWETDPVAAFARVWKDINGEESWTANPWVWVVSFARIEPQK